MFGRFTPQRRRKFKKHLIIWSVGMFLFVPLCMVIFPYLIGMPLGPWNSSITDLLFTRGAIMLPIFWWLLGAVAMLAAHTMNPLTKDERRQNDQENKPERISHDG